MYSVVVRMNEGRPRSPLVVFFSNIIVGQASSLGLCVISGQSVALLLQYSDPLKQFVELRWIISQHP